MVKYHMVVKEILVLKTGNFFGRGKTRKQNCRHFKTNNPKKTVTDRYKQNKICFMCKHYVTYVGKTTQKNVNGEMNHSFVEEGNKNPM